MGNAISSGGLHLSVILYIVNFLTMTFLIILNCDVLARKEMKMHAVEYGLRYLGNLESLQCRAYLTLSFWIMVPMSSKDVVQSQHPEGEACGKIYYKKQGRRETANTHLSRSAIIC